MDVPEIGFHRSPVVVWSFAVLDLFHIDVKVKVIKDNGVDLVLRINGRD